MTIPDKIMPLDVGRLFSTAKAVSEKVSVNWQYRKEKQTIVGTDWKITAHIYIEETE